MEQDIENILMRLGRSRFRAGIKLNKKDRSIYLKKGEAIIRKHAYDLIRHRLAPANPLNDARQTPFQGHPVFPAQHATATCCCQCLAKWHGLEKGRELTEEEITYVVELIML